MNYRLATILDRENHTADTTKVIDLNLQDPVSQMQIIYEPMNGAEAASTAHPAKCISKIELVDGSNVLFSLSGVECQAVDWYHRKSEALNWLWYLNDNASEMIFNMNFGRDLWDPEYAFDPRKFKNPQLKITIDIDAGGTNADAGQLTVLAHIFDEKEIAPVGMFIHKEIKDYALAAGTHEYIDLPTDEVYRKLFMRIQKYGTGTEYCFDTIKLSEDNDRRVPLNHSIMQILKSIMGQGRPYREWIITHGVVAGRYYHNTPALFPVFSGTKWTSGGAVGGIAVYEGDGGRCKVYAETAGHNVQLLCEGWCPHGVIELPFGIQNDPEDWYDVKKLGSLRLDVKSGSGMSSSESCQVFLQQLRKYAE